MASVVFYFQVHQPFRLRRYTVFDSDASYFDQKSNEDICRKVTGKCYLPTNRLILDLIERHQGRFRVSYSLTGTIIEQLQLQNVRCSKSITIIAILRYLLLLNHQR